MSGGVVCYIERTPGGAGIRRIRLIAAGLARHWTAPDPRSVSSVVGAGGVGDSAPAAVAVARAGALWIAETLNQVGLKRLAAVCVDAEGSICAWLSAPSPEPAVVRATIVQSGAEGDGGASGAGVGAARLLAESTPGGAANGLMGDTSLQALATLEPEPASRGLNLTPWKKKAEPVLIQRKHRYAVLAVQDAIARVLLDELDARGIETERVVTLWHAMAGAWDRAEAASLNDRLVASGSTGAAVILVEPAGRLIWAWTRAGELVAGGAMRLATRARTKPAESASRIEALATSDAARRAPDEPDTESLAIDFTSADAGRLAVDWLSWSAQLGHCPDRVVCLAVPGLGGGAADTTTGPEALFANLARVWPGATIDGAVHEDPIGATIARLAGLGPEVRVSMNGDRVELPAEVGGERPFHERPREAMAELSSRPGRADRRLHQWIGVALCGGAVLVGAIGYQFHASMDAATAELEAARKARIDALNAAAIHGQSIPRAPRPLEEMQNALRRLQDQNKAIKAPRPILRETLRLLAALNDVDIVAHPPTTTPAGGPGDDDENPADAAAPPTAPGAPETLPPGSIVNPNKPAPGPPRVVLNELYVNAVAATAKFVVPDSETGPTILEKVQARPGDLQWSGNTGSSVGTGRTYTLTGIWSEDSHTTGPTAPTPALAPAPAPAPPAAAPVKPASTGVPPPVFTPPAAKPSVRPAAPNTPVNAPGNTSGTSGPGNGGGASLTLPPGPRNLGGKGRGDVKH